MASRCCSANGPATEVKIDGEDLVVMKRRAA
jgi:hypothetical protein